MIYSVVFYFAALLCFVCVLKQSLYFSFHFCQAKINEKGIAISSKRDKPAADKAKIHHMLELTPGGKYELNSDVTFNLEKNNIKYLGEHLLKLHQQPDIKYVAFRTPLSQNSSHISLL